MSHGVLLVVVIAVFLPAVWGLQSVKPSRIEEVFKQERTLSSRQAAIYACNYTGPYGVPSGTFPDWYERVMMTWINYVRMAPLFYKTKYLAPYIMSGDTSLSNVFDQYLGNKTVALPWNLNLNRAARAHCDDTSNCYQDAGHSDCNGTDPFTRIEKFYPNWDSLGEIYFDYSVGWNLDGSYDRQIWPFFSVAGWVCDGSLYTSGQYIDCATDANAGHRQIIMTSKGEFGCGQWWAENSGEDVPISTCDFGDSFDGVEYPDTIIASGAHVFVPGSSPPQYFYLATVSTDSQLAGPVQVVINSATVNLTLESGTANHGNWVSPLMSVNGVTSCDSYYFQVQLVAGTSMTTVLYPAEGVFLTEGVGGCALPTGDTTQPGSNAAAFLKSPLGYWF